VATSNDRRLLRGLAGAAPLAAPRWIAHGFSFVFNPDGALAVAKTLERRRFAKVWVGEETTGDGFWHVCGWTSQPITARVLATTGHQLELLAERHGGRYDGWNEAPTFRRPFPLIVVEIDPSR
jgi:hypothetical protein